MALEAGEVHLCEVDRGDAARAQELGEVRHGQEGELLEVVGDGGRFDRARAQHRTPGDDGRRGHERREAERGVDRVVQLEGAQARVVLLELAQAVHHERALLVGELQAGEPLGAHHGLGGDRLRRLGDGLEGRRAGHGLDDAETREQRHHPAPTARH